MNKEYVMTFSKKSKNFSSPKSRKEQEVLLISYLLSLSSGTYNGTNPDGFAGTNLEYITLFSQPINDGDLISLSLIIY